MDTGFDVGRPLGYDLLQRGYYTLFPEDFLFLIEGLFQTVGTEQEYIAWRQLHLASLEGLPYDQPQWQVTVHRDHGGLRVDEHGQFVAGITVLQFMGLQVEDAQEDVQIIDDLFSADINSFMPSTMFFGLV